MRKIYVGNIALNITEQDIRDLFSEYGEMGSDSEAKKAISELNGKSFLGKPLSVSDAIQQQPRAVFDERKGGVGRDKNFRKAW